MKGLTRPWPYRRSLAFLCFLGLQVMSFNSVEAQVQNITTATQLLTLKDGELKSFVAAVEANARNCDALNGCSISTCSRLSCYQYGTPGDKSYSCLGVANNTFCTVSGSAPVCAERNFDFTKGYVRRVDQTTDSQVGQTVCTHRSLDDHFKNSTMSDPSRFFRVFFGAVDGTFRIYPGADESCEASLYDPRIRPWYLQSTDIPKVVTVLIDTGLNMYGTISGTAYETYINKAITTALSVLDTLTEDRDYVTIVCFDGDGIKRLNATAIYNKERMYQSFSDSLNKVEASPSTTNPNSTQTNNAINATISQLDRLTSSNSVPPTYLKVIIALIDGQQYKDIADLNLSATPNMNLFAYSFRTRQAPQCNPALRASIEAIPDDRLSNPLYALQSYYSFLAKLHINFKKNETDFGPLYLDFSGIDNSTLTLSKAAFGPNGELLGVLGLDFFEKKVEQQFPTIQFLSISNEAKSHESGPSFDVAVDLSINVCFNHTEACPGLDSANVQGFLCAKAKSPDINIGCCGTCKAIIPPDKEKETELGPVIGGVVGGCVVLVLVAGILIHFCCPCRNRNPGHGNRDAERANQEIGRTGHGDPVGEPDNALNGRSGPEDENREHDNQENGHGVVLVLEPNNPENGKPPEEGVSETRVKGLETARFP